jgi:hypothetical protein
MYFDLRKSGEPFKQAFMAGDEPRCRSVINSSVLPQIRGDKRDSHAMTLWREMESY